MNDKHPEIVQELDLTKIVTIFIKWRYLILSCIVSATVLASIYSLSKDTVYRGEIIIEIGQLLFNTDASIPKPTIIEPLENRDDLQEVVLQVMNNNSKDDYLIQIAPPKGRSMLLSISCDGVDKNKIMTKLQDTLKFVLSRHHERGVFFSKNFATVRQSSVVGTVKFSDENFKKLQWALIVGSLCFSAILGMILALICEYLSLIYRQKKP